MNKVEQNTNLNIKIHKNINEYSYTQKNKKYE